MGGNSLLTSGSVCAKLRTLSPRQMRGRPTPWLGARSADGTYFPGLTHPVLRGRHRESLPLGVQTGRTGGS